MIASGTNLLFELECWRNFRHQIAAALFFPSSMKFVDTNGVNWELWMKWVPGDLSAMPLNNFTFSYMIIVTSKFFIISSFCLLLYLPFFLIHLFPTYLLYSTVEMRSRNTDTNRAVETWDTVLCAVQMAEKWYRTIRRLTKPKQSLVINLAKVS